jgi:epoxide hydrolase
VAQLAWIVEKFHDWNKAVKTLEDGVGRDRLLTNATLYWLTGCHLVRAVLLRVRRAPRQDLHSRRGAEPVTVPIGVAVFAQDPGLPDPEVRRA